MAEQAQYNEKLVNTILKSVNYNLADNFELEIARKLSFVPVDIKKNTATGEENFFVAICKNSDQVKIKH